MISALKKIVSTSTNAMWWKDACNEFNQINEKLNKLYKDNTAALADYPAEASYLAHDQLRLESVKVNDDVIELTFTGDLRGYKRREAARRSVNALLEMLSIKKAPYVREITNPLKGVIKVTM